MADPISELPGDARRLVFAHLPLKSLLSCEAVSKQLHTAAVEDEVWQQRCEEHWPSANLGSTVATYRACFRSANGWSRLPALPRAVANVDPADGQRTSRRSAPVAPSICAFDASTHAQVCATSQRVCLRWAGQERTVEWANRPSLALADVKLLPGSEGCSCSGSNITRARARARARARTRTCYREAPRPLGLFRRGGATLLVPLGSDALAAPLWSSEDLEPGDTAARAPFDELLMTDDATSVLLVGRRAGWLPPPSIISLDLTRPAVTGRKASYTYSEGLCLPADELRSACNDPSSAPHQVTAAMKLGGAAARIHLRLPHTRTQTIPTPRPSSQPHPTITGPPPPPRPPRTGTVPSPTGESRLLHYDLRVGPIGCQHTCMATGHANVRRVRQGTAGTPYVLTSHTRSKLIELWDLRKFGSGLQAACRPVPVESFRCAGNAPDFHCEAGIIAAICGGAPGTTYGAKLHVFSSAPRRLAVETTLSEIVVDDAHRLACPLGVKLTGRTLTLIADKQRLLTLRVP
jgi:hypothetical protein